MKSTVCSLALLALVASAPCVFAQAKAPAAPKEAPAAALHAGVPVTGRLEGLAGFPVRAELVVGGAAELLTREAKKANLDKIASMSVDDILKDPALLAFAQAGGGAC